MKLCQLFRSAFARWRLPLAATVMLLISVLTWSSPAFSFLPRPPDPTTPVDYDTDDDGLLEVSTPEQLDAIRHDLDGDGTPTAEGASGYRHRHSYSVFNSSLPNLGCPSTCRGYELTGDLDLDANKDGAIDATVVGCLDDTWVWRDFQIEWSPIGSDTDPFNATFEGNGYTISNLYTNRRIRIRPFISNAVIPLVERFFDRTHYLSHGYGAQQDSLERSAILCRGHLYDFGVADDDAE